METKDVMSDITTPDCSSCDEDSSDEEEEDKEGGAKDNLAVSVEMFFQDYIFNATTYK